MNQEQAGQELPLPQRIYEGMTVYDREGEVVFERVEQGDLLIDG